MKKTLKLFFGICILSSSIYISGCRSSEIVNHEKLEKQNINQIWEYIVDSKKLNQSNCHIIDTNMEGLTLRVQRDTNIVYDLMLEFISVKKSGEGDIFDIKYNKENDKISIYKRNTIDTTTRGYNIKNNIEVSKILSFVSKIDLNEIKELENNKGEFFQIYSSGQPVKINKSSFNDKYIYYSVKNDKLEKISPEIYNKHYVPIYVSVVNAEIIDKDSTIYRSSMDFAILMEINYE